MESYAAAPSGGNLGLPNRTITGLPVSGESQGTAPSLTPLPPAPEPVTEEARRAREKREDEEANASAEASTGETCTRKLRRCGRNLDYTTFCAMAGRDTPHDCVTDVRFKQCVSSCTALSENDCSGDERRLLASMRNKCTTLQSQISGSNVAPLVQQQFPAPQGFYDVNPASTAPAPAEAPAAAPLPVVGPTPVPRPQQPTPAPHVPVPPVRPAHLNPPPQDVNPATAPVDSPTTPPSHAHTPPSPSTSPNPTPSEPSGPSFYIPDTSTASRSEMSGSELPTLPQQQVDPSSISFNNSSAIGGTVPTASDGVSSDGSGGGGSSAGSGARGASSAILRAQAE